MKEIDPLEILPRAIQQENWELAALCIVTAAVEMARRLPPDSAEALLQAWEVEGQRRLRGRRRRGRRR